MEPPPYQDPGAAWSWKVEKPDLPEDVVQHKVKEQEERVLRKDREWKRSHPHSSVEAEAGAASVSAQPAAGAAEGVAGAGDKAGAHTGSGSSGKK